MTTRTERASNMTGDLSGEGVPEITAGVTEESNLPWAKRPGKDPDARPLTLATGHSAIQKDDEDPRQPAHPFTPRQRPEHEPRLRDGRRPGQPVSLQQRERTRDDTVGPIAVGARLGQVPH